MAAQKTKATNTNKHNMAPKTDKSTNGFNKLNMATPQKHKKCSKTCSKKLGSRSSSNMPKMAQQTQNGFKKEARPKICSKKLQASKLVQKRSNMTSKDPNWFQRAQINFGRQKLFPKIKLAAKHEREAPNWLQMAPQLQAPTHTSSKWLHNSRFQKKQIEPKFPDLGPEFSRVPSGRLFAAIFPAGVDCARRQCLFIMGLRV